MAAKSGKQAISMFLSRNPTKHLISSWVVSTQLFTLDCLGYLFVPVTNKSQSLTVNSWSKTTTKILGKEHRQLHPAFPSSLLELFGIFFPYDCESVFVHKFSEVEGSLPKLSANSWFLMSSPWSGLEISSSLSSSQLCIESLLSSGASKTMWWISLRLLFRGPCFVSTNLPLGF